MKVKELINIFFSEEEIHIIVESLCKDFKKNNNTEEISKIFSKLAQSTFTDPKYDDKKELKELKIIAKAMSLYNRG